MPNLFKLTPPVSGDLQGIQYLRGAAALMVVLDHISSMMAEPKYFSAQPFAGFLGSGFVGVDIFFCLSGFIIMYIAMTDQLQPKLQRWKFFKHRFARIVPFMWVMVIAYALLRGSFRNHFPYGNYLRAITLYPIGQVEPGTIWSLRHEFLFYIVFAITLLSSRIALAGRFLLFAVWALSPLAVFVLMPEDVTKFVLVPESFPGESIIQEWVSFFFSNVNLLFGLGVIIGAIYVKSGRQWKPRAWSAPSLIFCLAAIFLTVWLINYNRGNIIEALFIGLLSCVCLLFALTVKPSTSLFARLGKTLGDASYCIYLSHNSFISISLSLFTAHFHAAPKAAVIGATLLFATVGGVVLNRLVEDPVVFWSKRAILGRPSERQAKSAALKPKTV
jgi:peptidoglycan/LPS O-acetylase OafA/YrhL